MQPPPDLAPLIAAVARGERPAFSQLYELTAPKLLGVVLRIVRDRSLAEDVVQDAYLKVWHGASSYVPEAGRPMAWLVSIARYRAIDVMRRRREAQLPINEDGSDWLDTVADPADHEGDFVERNRLRVCLERLDETQRRCFLAAYHDGFSREELAQRFDRPVNTIKTWLHRSANALRGCLEAS